MRAQKKKKKKNPPVVELIESRVTENTCVSHPAVLFISFYYNHRSTPSVFMGLGIVRSRSPPHGPDPAAFSPARAGERNEDGRLPQIKATSPPLLHGAKWKSRCSKCSQSRPDGIQQFDDKRRIIQLNKDGVYSRRWH